MEKKTLKNAFVFVALVLGLGCTKPEAFTLTVVPRTMNAIAGQRCVFLVEIPEDERNSTAAYITASAANAEVYIDYSPISEAEVAEVVVIADSASTNDTIDVEIEAKRAGVVSSDEVSIAVLDWGEGPREEAEALRDTFISWLEVNNPELGIDTETSWIPTSVSPAIFEVSHYLFFSEEWEFKVSWHVMIAPYDWAEMYLRRRGDSEMTPSYALKIDSRSAGDEPHSIPPPDSIWR